ncbi:DUF1783-domain-containing protein [Cucurbitaria berberidis CBS 394.84]|uniref:DUF1783-domain-containing protein n=1 Tax=Cucurbitaria berberidis CBS 394.84 TaxID=1168544 RepID=A0A9P4GNA7_9PLEO|nr:DUF1783-domain-containing protein [Cucurbitaria berberidis CBS 394.84]KAF1849603.1 DUF1783-domain-containing protein [Cucurbitaria berberidis CBS 394.84]
MPPPRLSLALIRAPAQIRLQCIRRIAPFRYASTAPTHEASTPVVPWKTPTSVWSPENLIPPPKDGEVLMERKPNRELPPIPPLIPTQVRNTLPIFVIAMAISLLAFFNYQKTESSVVSSTLYALRTNPLVREQLGDEIYFASKHPWISGEINQVHGRINISFWVKGTKAVGQVKLRCRRRGKGGFYFTQEYSLTVLDPEAEGGERRLELYDPNGNAIDPFQDPIGDE